MNIVLIGYRGTGKSAVGQILADKLKRTLINMDAEIVNQAGRSIPEIVAQGGWDSFRDLETAEVSRLSGLDGLVIDCGGGVIERPGNINILQKQAQVFWLKASVATIVNRIEGDNQRPALTDGKSFTEEVSEVLEQRIPKYRSAAHFEIETDQFAPTKIAETIIGLLKK